MSITTRSERNFDWGATSTGRDVGPGSYDVPELFMKVQESPYPFNTTAARYKDNPNQNPSPCDYSPILPKLNIKGGMSSFQSNSARNIFPTIQSPGPADFSQLCKWGSPRIPSMRPQMSSRAPRKTSWADVQFHESSPCTYNTTPKSTKGVTMARSGRTYRRAAKSPGTADYNTYLKRVVPPNMNSVLMSTTERKIFEHPDWIVDRDGMSQEQWKLPSKGVPFGSNAKRRGFWTGNRNPSPCQYSITKEREFKNSIVAFGQGSDRDSLFKGSDNPGPADYNTYLQGTSKTSRLNVPFNVSAKRFVPYRAPYDACVAQYNIDTEDNINKQKTLSRQSPPFKAVYDRDPYKVTTNTPGVGTYNLTNTANHKLGNSLPTAPRNPEGMFMGQYIQDTPGAGAYDHERSPRRVHGGYISKGGRKGLWNSTETPGPGAYLKQGSLFKPSLNATYNVLNDV